MTVPRGIAGALAAMVADDLDVADVLAHLLAACATATGASSVAVLAHDGDDQLSLLSATSHRAVQLEMLQAQRHEGPCVETMRTGRPVHSNGADELRTRWGVVGDALVDAGFARVEAFPMSYRGEMLGGLNLFWSEPGPPVEPGVGQAFADMATVVIAHSVLLTRGEVLGRLQEALRARETVEQAKGVIAYVEDVDLERAYDLLVGRAQGSEVGLTATALDVVRRRGLS